MCPKHVPCPHTTAYPMSNEQHCEYPSRCSYTLVWVYSFLHPSHHLLSTHHLGVDDSSTCSHQTASQSSWALWATSPSAHVPLCTIHPWAINHSSVVSQDDVFIPLSSIIHVSFICVIHWP